MLLRTILLVLIGLGAKSASADPTVGLSLAYGNPLESEIGLNILARLDHVGFEAGIGYGSGGSNLPYAMRESIDAENDVDGELMMDIDLKVYLGPKHLELYLELGYSLGYNFYPEPPFFGLFATGFAGSGLVISSEGRGKGYFLYSGAVYIFDKYDYLDENLSFEIGVGYGFY